MFENFGFADDADCDDESVFASKSKGAFYKKSSFLERRSNYTCLIEFIFSKIECYFLTIVG